MANSQTYKLTVHQAKNDDIYSDIIRVHKSNRNCVREGRICKVSVVNGVSAFFAIRGLSDGDKEKIRLDEVGRDRLRLNIGDEREFNFAEASYFEAVCWATKTSEPGARIATWIALLFGGLSVILGVMGVALGFCALK